MIMLFDLINAFSTFQHFINDVFQKYLNVFCTTYIDDILIYNNFKKNHIKTRQQDSKTTQESKHTNKHRQIRVSQNRSHVLKSHRRYQ